MRHAFDSPSGGPCGDASDRSAAAPAGRGSAAGGPFGARFMCLLATVLLAPHVWLLATLANFDAGRHAIAHAMGRRRDEPELPYPLVGSLAGVSLAGYAALALPGVSVGEMLTLPVAWAIILIPEWAWLAPAAIARLIGPARAGGGRKEAWRRYDARGAFSAR